MFIVSSLLSRIGALIKTGTPEANDAAIIVPNTYYSRLPFPHVNPSSQTGTYDNSFSTVLQGTITNTPGGLVTVGPVLNPGIWELLFFIDSEFNWLNANPIAQDNRLVLTASAINNIDVWASAAKISRVTMEYGTLIYTLEQPHTIRLIQNGNGVGQTSTFNVYIHANKLL